MFDILFGWRKASKCKKLIKKFQCRLNLLKNKRLAVAEQSRVDIVQLLKYGYKQVAFKRLDDLYMDESMVSLYDMLDQFSEFIILNLSYIRRHKDLPNDVHEAVSTLVFASARCGDLPELMLVRKLFGERYGQKFIIRAVELYPGNLVNQQVKEKLIPHSVTEDVKNRLLDEIVRGYFCKPGVLALDYKPDFQLQPKEGTELYEHEDVLALEYMPEYPQKVTEFYEDEGQDTCINEHSSTSSTSCSIVLHSSSPIVETPEQEKVQNLALTSAPYEYETGIVAVREVGESEKSDCSSEYSNFNSEETMIYLDDVQEFKSPTKHGTYFEEQDQRFFLFSFSPSDDTNLDRKRMRRSASREKQNTENLQCEIYYGYESSDRRKYQKMVPFDKEEGNYLLDQGSKKLEMSNNAACNCGLHQPCYSCTNDNNEGQEIMLLKNFMNSPLSSKCVALNPYVRAATMPERWEMEVKSTEIVRSSSLPVETVPKEYNGGTNSVSPRHVHPKLPDYDEIAAKFRELKRLYQLNRSIKSYMC